MHSPFTRIQPFRIPVLLILSVILMTFNIGNAYAANCDGLPVTGSTIPTGTYTLSDNCTITETLVVDSAVTINGDEFSISGGDAFRIFTVEQPGS